MIVLTHRIRLDPNNVQATWLKRCAGATRFVFNWGLARWQTLYKSGEKPNWRKLNAELNSWKKTKFPWLIALPWAVSNNALRDLGNAFSHFFRRTKLGRTKCGYPRFKSKKRTTPSFAIEGRALKFEGRKIKVPKLGWVRMRETLRFPGKILSARFTKRAEHWYVSVQVEIDESRWSYPHRCETQAVVGVDRGVVNLAVLSNGEQIKAPRVLRRYETKLRQVNKELTRRTKGGKNWQKTKMKLGRLHERIANIRQDLTHKLTTSLVQRFRWIGIEDLNIAGMTRGRLAKSVLDAAMAEIKRQLDYKAPLAGSVIVIADRWFASSKICSTCNVIYTDLVLGERRWTCNTCGTTHDRDENAAKNLETMAAAQTVTACRQRSSGLDLRTEAKLLHGQESSNLAVN